MRFLTFLCCFIFMLSKGIAASQTCPSDLCIAVIDAGSTGSRLHIYAYNLDATNSPTQIKEIWNKKIKPGFASIEPNENTIEAYLTTLLSGAPIHNIPVYFFATAGMRLVSPAKQKLYYEALQTWFSHQSTWQLKEAKTISGKDEALYDWLSVNYQLGTLQSTQNISVGVLDMGGASVQIVFPIQNTTQALGKTKVELDLYGQHLTLFVHSFLGLGQNEVSHQFLSSASCFSNNFPLPDGDSGQGDALSCAQGVSSLMNGVHKVNQVVQPLLSANPVDSWFTIGGLSHLADSKVFHFKNNQFTNHKLLQKADKKLCHQQWELLHNQYPNEDYLYEFCLFSAYYYSLMVDGYGIYAEQKVNYIPPDQNQDWTIGVVLHHK